MQRWYKVHVHDDDDEDDDEEETTLRRTSEVPVAPRWAGYYGFTASDRDHSHVEHGFVLGFVLGSEEDPGADQGHRSVQEGTSSRAWAVLDWIG